MKILKVGDTQKAICYSCEGIESITFRLTNAPIDNGLGVVKDVLMGICDSCDSIVSLPHQSTPMVKKQIEKKRKSVEARLPSHMIDILNLASEAVGGTTDFNSQLIKYYVHGLSSEKINLNGLPKFLESELINGAAQKRLSIKGSNIYDEIELLKKMFNIDSTAKILKVITLKIKSDLLDKPKVRVKRQLENILAANA